MESTITAKLATNSANTNTINQISWIQYWIVTPETGSLNQWNIALLAAASTLILIAVFALLAYRLLSSNLTPPKQKFFDKACWTLVAFGPIGWLLVLARLEGVVFFSARFWWTLWFLSLIAVLVYLYRDWKKIPAKETQYQTYQLKKRYFPKKKR